MTSTKDIGMSDKELLEMAAKAYEKTIIKDLGKFYLSIGEHEDGSECLVEWNPLINDAQALCLAIALEISIEFDHIFKRTIAEWDVDQGLVHMWFDNGKEVATKKAIVRAAAEIGKSMK